MRSAEGHYWIPVMSKDMAERIAGRPRVDWPKDVEADYRRLHSEFTASKAEFASWVRKDRDGRMSATAKLILLYLVECLNFDTGRCDPSHQAIADELEIGLRTVQRIMPQILQAGWIGVVRRGKTTSNFYRLRVPTDKIHRLMDRVDELRERRAEVREERRRRHSEPPLLADHSESEPPFESSHEPPLLAAHEPPLLADKPLKGTSEGEPLKSFMGAEGEGDTSQTDREQESAYEPSGSLEESRQFLIKIGVPPHRMGAALQRYMREALFPCDVEGWKQEAQHGRSA
jgi:hypothetical protein